MSTATHQQQPWTDPAFSPRDTPDRELRPYRVEYGDETYDQRVFTNNTSKRYHAYVGGVGSGKTIGGIQRVAANVMEWNPGSMGAIITPTTYGIKNAVLPKLQRWGFLDTWEYHGPQSEAPGLHAPNGTRILLESANNERKIERLRGFDLAWFWLDEAAYVPKRAWSVLVGRLRIGDYRNAFITTTPKGYNWVHDKFINPETSLDSVNVARGVPSYANPHLPLDYRRDILSDYEGQFHEQEVLGRFVEFKGKVYPWYDPDTHIIQEARSNIQEVIYGVDWGFYPHPACILAIGFTGQDNIVVLEEHYETRNNEEDLANKARRMQERHGPGPFYCDPSEPSSIETFQRHGLHAQKADNSVTPGIQHVSSKADRIRVVDTCQSVKNEFNQYRYEEDGEEPVDENDHAMDALRYALFTHSQEGGHSVGVAFA